MSVTKWSRAKIILNEIRGPVHSIPRDAEVGMLFAVSPPTLAMHLLGWFHSVFELDSETLHAIHVLRG